MLCAYLRAPHKLLDASLEEGIGGHFVVPVRSADCRPEACSPDRRRTTHHAEKLEHKVWDLVSGLLKDPERLRIDLEKMTELEREEMRGDPQREVKVWLEKRSEIE